MSEWWTYRLDDFLMFSPATYWRVVEQYHRSVWPGQILGVAVGLLLVGLTLSRRTLAWRGQAFVLAAIWAWIAWAFYLQRYAAIHWAAGYFALAFSVQAGLLLALAFMPAGDSVPANGKVRTVGWVLVAAGLVVVPLLGSGLGRPWSHVEIFGVSPRATALTTLGLILARRQTHALLRWSLLIVPVLSLAEGAATLLSLYRMSEG